MVDGTFFSAVGYVLETMSELERKSRDIQKMKQNVE